MRLSPEISQIEKDWIRTGKSVRALSDWNSVTTSPEVGASPVAETFACELRDTDLQLRPRFQQTSAAAGSSIAAFRAGPYRDLKMLFRAQGKLHHPFEQLVRGQASEIAHDQLLGVEPHKVAKLQRLAA